MYWHIYIYHHIIYQYLKPPIDLEWWIEMSKVSGWIYNQMIPKRWPRYPPYSWISDSWIIMILCRWHEINTGFESSQHIDGKKHIQGFLPQMFQLWDVFFFFRCNKRRIGPSFPDLLDWKIQASDGILVASKLVKHFGGKKTPNISGFQTNLPWKNVLAQRLGADLVSLKGAEKKNPSKKTLMAEEEEVNPKAV